jgi:two-component sensor histidine kinase
VAERRSDRLQSLWRAGLRPGSAAAVGFAIVCVAIATGVRMLLDVVGPDSAAFAPYYSATLVADLVGGTTAGALAMLLGGAIAYCLFLPPEWTLTTFPLANLIGLGLYGASSVVIIWAAKIYRSLLSRLREQEDHLRLLNAELKHRIKNTLASIQAVVGQELRGQRDVFEKISARIIALGATHDLLIRSQGQTASLRDILQGEFAPYGTSRVRLVGDDIQCPSNLAMQLALMFHELTTNAVKYGALSNSDGRIDISWSEATQWLTIDWIESGAPEFTPPTHQGFGTKLLRLGLKQFLGRMETEFHSTGLRFKIFLLMPETSVRAHDIDQKTDSPAQLQTRPRGLN